MNTQPPVYFDVPRADRLSRLLIFFKWLLILPHGFVLWAYGALASVIGFIAVFAVLFTGSYPAGMWDISYGYLRWSTRVSVYLMLLRDEYPPFGDGPYPMELSLQRPYQQSRLLVIARIFTTIPIVLWLSLVGFAAAFAAVASWFCILITGNIPSGLHDFLVGYLRYSVKVSAYSSLLTDAWPGFSLD